MLKHTPVQDGALELATVNKRSNSLLKRLPKVKLNLKELTAFTYFTKAQWVQ